MQIPVGAQLDRLVLAFKQEQMQQLEQALNQLEPQIREVLQGHPGEVLKADLDLKVYLEEIALKN